MKTPLILIPIVGLILLGLATWFGVSTFYFVKEGQTTEGRVVDFVRHTSTDSNHRRTVTYSPVVEFIVDGQKLRFQSKTSSSSGGYQKGETVPVLYLPANPQKAEIHTFFRLWLSTVVFGAMGSIFTAVGVGALLVNRPKKKPEEAPPYFPD